MFKKGKETKGNERKGKEGRERKAKERKGKELQEIGRIQDTLKVIGEQRLWGEGGCNEGTTNFYNICPVNDKTLKCLCVELHTYALNMRRIVKCIAAKNRILYNHNDYQRPYIFSRLEFFKLCFGALN